MFPAVSIDAGVGNVGISTSSYVEDSFALTSSFSILAFFLNKMIVTMTRVTVEEPTTSKITVKIEAITATLPLPLEPENKRKERNFER